MYVGGGWVVYDFKVEWVKENDFIVRLKDKKGKVEKRCKVRVRR